MRGILTFLTMGLLGLISAQPDCTYIDNLAICKTESNLTIEEYQTYCPDTHKVCDIKNYDELNFLSKYSDLDCTVSNLVQSQGVCGNCNRENFMGNLIHFGNCQATSRFLQAGASIDTYETTIFRSRLIATPSDIYSFSYNNTVINLNKTLLLQIAPTDIYYIPQIFQSSATGKTYRLGIKIIFDELSYSPYPSIFQPSDMSMRPSVPPSDMSVPPSDMSVPPSVPPSDMSMRPSASPTSDKSVPSSVPPSDMSMRPSAPPSDKSVPPSVSPTGDMSMRPSAPPSDKSVPPSVSPTGDMTTRPSAPPSDMTMRPSASPSDMTMRPSASPTSDMTMRPSTPPSDKSVSPSVPPSQRPFNGQNDSFTVLPTIETSMKPSSRPMLSPYPSFISRETPMFSQLSNPTISEFSCNFRGLLLKEGAIINTLTGICKCNEKQITCEMPKCVAGKYIVNRDNNCKGMPFVRQVACCKKQYINCTLGQMYDKNTNQCVPKIRCINGNVTSENTCICNQGFTGKYCEKSCRLDLCYNKGECRFQDNNFKTCVCDSGWTGEFCKDRINTGLVCVNGYFENNMCKCYNGFTGRLCTIEVPCVYGQVNNAGVCICNPGYGGRMCDMKMIVNNIPSFIMPNNTCYRGYFESNQCVCEPGWTGTKCEQSKCFMGRFNPMNNTCICRPEWTGPKCDMNCKEKCSWHGNLCTSTNYGQCACENNWYGEKCQNFKAEPNKNIKVPLSSSDSLNFTISSRFNMNITSQICNTPNCLPIQFTIANNSRFSLGRILQSDSITFAYTVEANNTLTLQEVNNAYTVNQVYSNGVLSASNLIDGSYVLVIGEASNNQQQTPSSQTPSSQTPSSQDSNNKMLGYVLGGASGGVLVVGIVVAGVIIKNNRRTKTNKIIKNPHVHVQGLIIENPSNFAVSSNIEKQNLIDNRNNFKPTNVRNEK